MDGLLRDHSCRACGSRYVHHPRLSAVRADDGIPQLQSNMPLDPRVEFHRVSIQASVEGLKAYSTGGQRSSRVASLAGANGVVILPSKVEGDPSEMKVGEFVDAIVIGELQIQQ